MKTAFFSHPSFLLHSNGPSHPERPERLAMIEVALEESGAWNRLVHTPFEAASEADLKLCHTPAHVARVKELARSGGGNLDGDTHVGPQSFEVARLAVGAACEAVRVVMRGEADNAFVAARPCGHHAESGRNPDSPWGFCLFNNVAVAARVAQRELGVKRVAILDFDVHHGNGTQEIFYADDSVFFASVHESPLFPGTGAAWEIGEGKGKGCTLNFPLPAGAKGDVYREVWAQIGDAVKTFQPELIILSAGYDAHKNDPLAHMKLEVEDFAWFVDEARTWANELCGGKLVAVLEGGYNLNALGKSVVATVEVLGREL